MEFRTRIADTLLTCRVTEMGGDILVSLTGGDTPHIGCACLAEPRASLTGEGKSATVSTLNRTGHKDDVLAADIAHRVAAVTGHACVCVCGVHLDGASAEALEEIARATKMIATEVLARITPPDGNDA